MLHAAAWQHEAAAAIQRQMRGYRATPAEGHPTTGWRSSPEAEVRNARLVQDNRDLKAANEELRTKLQTELQRAHMSSKCEPEKMEAELRAAAERARRLELELEAARAARAELMAGQAASERKVQQLRTELQVAEERLGAWQPLHAGESSTLKAAVQEAQRSLPPSPVRKPPSPACKPPSPAPHAAEGADGHCRLHALDQRVRGQAD